MSTPTPVSSVPVPDPAQGGGLSGAELQRRAISGSLWTAIQTVTSVPVVFLANAVVARILGAGSYGQLAFLTLAVSLATLITNLGVSDAVIQWGSAAEARGDRRVAEGLLRRSLGYHLLVQLPLLIVAVMILAWHEPLWVKCALIVSVSFPAALGSSSLSLSIENKTAAAARLVMVTNLLIQASLVAAAALTHSAAGVWATRSAAASLLLPLNLLLLDRVRRRVAVSALLPRGFPPGFWRYALQSSFAGLLSILVYSRSEIFLLQAFASSNDVGQFALAFGVALQITGPVDAMLGPLLPSIAGLMSAAADASTRALERSLRFTSVMTGAIVAVVLPPLYFALPTIYGHDFAAAADIFLPLAVMSCIQSSLAPVIAFLNARRRSGLLVRVNIVALAVDVAVAVAAIPVVGVWGAVIANAIGQLTALGMLAREEAHAHGHGVGWLLRQISGLVPGAAALGVAVGVPLLAGLATVPAMVASLVLGTAIYGVAVRALGVGLTEGDRSALVGAVSARVARPVAAFARLF